MNHYILCLAVVSLLACATTGFPSFDDYCKLFNKSYSGDEWVHRQQVYESNVERIASHNRHHHAFQRGVNQFTDMTRQEFRALHVSTRSAFEARPKRFLSKSLGGDDTPLPAQLDWVSAGIVTEVQNQAACGSCYAFSGVGAIESRVHKELKNGLVLSEQEIVDCSGAEGNHGCNGGLMDYVFEFAQQFGMCLDSDYSYKAKQGKCTRSSCKPGLQPRIVSGYVDVHPNDVNALMKALQGGPVAVAIEADERVFQEYQSGVITHDCGADLNHGVLLVGYGTDQNTKLDFWKVKNSWGPKWGEDGYVRIARNVTQVSEFYSSARRSEHVARSRDYVSSTISWLFGQSDASDDKPDTPDTPDIPDKPIEGGLCGILLAASYPEIKAPSEDVSMLKITEETEVDSSGVALDQ